MKVFYSAAAEFGGAIDYVRADGNGLYSGKTLDQIRLEHPDVEIVEEDECVRRDEARRTTPPREITKEDWWELLEVLPPCKWGRFGGAEAFHISERITHSIVTWCVRIGKRYYRMEDTDRLEATQAISVVCRHLEEHPEVFPEVAA